MCLSHTKTGQYQSVYSITDFFMESILARFQSGMNQATHYRAFVICIAPSKSEDGHLSYRGKHIADICINKTCWCSLFQPFY